MNASPKAGPAVPATISNAPTPLEEDPFTAVGTFAPRAITPARSFRFAFGAHHPDALRAFDYQKAAAERYGQRWSEAHAHAFRELQQAYVLTALNVPTHQRTAWPLAVGTGKTQSIVAFCKAQSERVAPLSLMVCMDRCVQMRDLYHDLLAAGVPAELIAVHHTKAQKDVEADGLPLSTPLSDVARFPFLIATHSMMLRDERNITALNQYQGKVRGLIVWDESLVKSQGHHFDLAGMESAVAVLGVACRDTQGELRGDAREAYEALNQYLQALRCEFESHFSEPSYVTPLHIKKPLIETGERTDVGLIPKANWPEGAVTRYEAAVSAVMREGRSRGATEGLRKLLMELFDYALRPVRVIPYREKGFRAGVIRYESLIPESLSRLIVLDASHNIRRLTSKHDTSLHTTSVNCSVKSFGSVAVNCIQQGAGKDSLAKALRSKSSVVLKELIERVQAMPADEAALIVTFKDELKDKGRGLVHYVALTKAALRKAGVDTDALLPDGRPRFTFITWGQHLGVCSYAYCKHLFAVGVTRRWSLDIASAIAGQQDDLNTLHAADLAEVSQVELSEMFHNLMQFAGRGSCRNTVDGCAEAMNLTVICNDTFPAELWRTAMPCVVVHEARSKHATKHKRTSATAAAIAKAFTEVRGCDEYVSARTIKALAGLLGMPANKFSAALAKARKQGIEGWTYQKDRQGFTRCPFKIDEAA